MKLLAFTLPSLPVLGSLGNVMCDKPPHNLKGWRVVIRGPALFLVSPPGWAAGLPMTQFDAKGPTHTFEIPRAECVLRWESIDLDAVAKYDGEPMGVDVTPVMSDDELERATAPRRAAK